jgi:hypothetical protein
MDASDAELIRASVTDPLSFSVVFDRHYRRVRRHLGQRVDAEAAEELASETTGSGQIGPAMLPGGRRRRRRSRASRTGRRLLTHASPTTRSVLRSRALPQRLAPVDPGPIDDLFRAMACDALLAGT